jgi:hypothetical protein
MRKPFIVLGLALFLATTALGGSRNWQDATVLDMGSSQGPLVAAPVNGMLIAGRVTWIHYIVETADLRYDLAVRKNLNITLHGPTRLATDGKHAFLIDDDGKEKKLIIYSKTAKQSAPAPSPTPAPK